MKSQLDASLGTQSQTHMHTAHGHILTSNGGMHAHVFEQSRHDNRLLAALCYSTAALIAFWPSGAEGVEGSKAVGCVVVGSGMDISAGCTDTSSGGIREDIGKVSALRLRSPTGASFVCVATGCSPPFFFARGLLQQERA